MLEIFRFIFSFLGDILNLLDSFIIDNDVSLLALYCALLILPLIFAIFRLGINYSVSGENAYFNYSMRENAKNKYEQRAYIGKHTYNGKHTKQYIKERKRSKK